MDWIQLTLSLIGVIGLIVMLFYALRKLNKKISVGGGNRMRILDRVNLGRDGMLLVVNVCGKLMLLGVTAQRVEKICDLDVSEEDYFPGGAQQQDFKTILASALGKKNGSAANQKDDENAENTDTDTTE